MGVDLIFQVLHRQPQPSGQDVSDVDSNAIFLLLQSQTSATPFWLDNDGTDNTMFQICACGKRCLARLQ